MSHQLENVGNIDARFRKRDLTETSENVAQAVAPVDATDLNRRQPFHIYKQEQGRFARRRLYPITLFYGGFAALVLTFALRSAHPFVAVFFFIFGIIFNSLGEYAFHRWLLHGRFEDGPGIIQHYLHYRIDPLHWPHHDTPFDGRYLAGQLKDLMPLFLPSLFISIWFPVYLFLSMLAGTVVGYIFEEWIHHGIHFFNFRGPYFRYVRRHHLYHHSPKGIDKGFGITNGVWDYFFDTRFPPAVQALLYQRVP